MPEKKKKESADKVPQEELTREELGQVTGGAGPTVVVGDPP